MTSVCVCMTLFFNSDHLNTRNPITNYKEKWGKKINVQAHLRKLHYSSKEIARCRLLILEIVVWNITSTEDHGLLTFNWRPWSSDSLRRRASWTASTSRNSTYAYPFGCPYLLVRMVTLLTVPHDWKCCCTSSGVHE